MTDEYVHDIPMPEAFVDYAGPKGPALVRAWPSGMTDEGWGLNPPKNGGDGFMPRYMRGEFSERRPLYGYERGRWAFAFVMRSLQLVCIDIDGKNGGFEHAKRIGMLPPTLAETSKSGNGYHLFYLHEEEWDPVTGYGQLNDRIGLEQGVDFRATGCVYHHNTQRWNMRQPAVLPDHVFQQLHRRQQQQSASTARIFTVLANEDPLEVLMMQDTLVDELAKPIPAGKRNNTLFAIGSQMMLAQVPDWERLVTERADHVGLGADEISKLVGNINRYGASQQVQP
jgi:hypothetical protein